MDEPAPAGAAATSDVVRLHLHRGWGWGLYGSLTVVVVVVAVLTVRRYLIEGDLALAGVATVGGLAAGGLLGVLTYSIVWPELTASARGIRGRLCGGQTIDADWDAITIDVDDDAEPGTLRLDLAPEPVSISRRSWIGFDRFVVLVDSSADAASRLTPEARRAVLRMFGSP